MRTGLRLMTAALFGVIVFGARGVLAIGDGDPVKLSIDVASEYTDNRDAVSDSLAEENVDFFLTPRLEALFRAVKDRTVLSLYYAPSYRYRTEPSDIQNDTELQHSLGVEFKHRIVERWSMRAHEQFFLTDDPAIIEGGTTLRRDCSFTANRAELETGLRVAPLTDLSLLGRHYIKMYEEDLVAEESDEESVDGRLRLWVAFAEQFGMLVDVKAEQWTYDSARGLERGFTAISAGLGLEKLIGAALRSSLSAGWKTLSYDDSALGDESAPYAQVMLQVTPASGQMRVTASGTYMLRDSDVYPFASQQYTGLGLDLEWKPVSRWTLGLGGEYRLGDYDAKMAPVEHTDPTYVRPVSGQEETLMGNARVAFNFDEKTKLQLVQSLEDVQTDLDPRYSWDYTRNATRLTFSRQF